MEGAKNPITNYNRRDFKNINPNVKIRDPQNSDRLNLIKYITFHDSPAFREKFSSNGVSPDKLERIYHRISRREILDIQGLEERDIFYFIK